jgi:hypothetical protein
VNEEEAYLEEDKKAKDKQRFLENVLRRTFARMDKLAFAGALGAVAGLLFFMATVWLVVKNGAVVGPDAKAFEPLFCRLHSEHERRPHCLCLQLFLGLPVWLAFCLPAKLSVGLLPLSREAESRIVIFQGFS